MSRKSRIRISELEKKIEELEAKNGFLRMELSRREIEQSSADKDMNGTLRECYRREEKLKEKYARLLERYVKFMEEVADNEHREAD